MVAPHTPVARWMAAHPTVVTIVMMSLTGAAVLTVALALAILLPYLRAIWHVALLAR